LLNVFIAMTLVKIGKAAEMLGVKPQTLLAWERSGELVPDRRSRGGVRYYDITKITGLSTGLGSNEGMLAVGYARVTGPGQEADLTRQEELLEAFCAARGWRHEILSDSGRGPGFGSAPGAGLKRLLKLILYKRVHRLVVTRKDRLLRFGSELIFALCDIQNIEIAVINQGDPPTLSEEEDLAQDIELRRLCERLIKDADASVDAGVPGDGAFSSSGEPPAGGNGKASDLGTE
jgi:predicted site-specific integrase-resolvase